MRPPRPARRGIASTELALLLPFLCTLFVVTIDYSRIFYYSVTVTNCARNGAVYGSANTTCALDSTGITSAAQMDAGNLNTKLMQVTPKTDSNTSPTYVDVTVTYPFTTLTKYPGIPNSVTLSRTIRAQVVPWVPDGN
jgi:Flp pilus assembly protein TadG